MANEKLPFQVRGIRHVSLVVKDLKRARSFYEGILGLIPIRRPAGVINFPGAWYFLGRAELHLMEVNEEGAVLNPFQHVALEVSDIQLAKKVLETNNIPIIGDEKSGAGGFYCLYCYDPDGNRIELCQPVYVVDAPN